VRKGYEKMKNSIQKGFQELRDALEKELELLPRLIHRSVFAALGERFPTFSPCKIRRHFAENRVVKGIEKKLFVRNSLHLRRNIKALKKMEREIVRELNI
jgi:hypothetical protein